MASTFRIPAADVTGPVGATLAAWARRTYGDLPDNARVLWHHRQVTGAWLAFERKVQRWRAVDPQLKVLATMAAAAPIGCSWCLDFGYYLAHADGLDETKVREVPRWREARCFTQIERDVMAYAESMTATPPQVSDEQVGDLIEQLGSQAMVELTAIIALENMRSRFNSAAGLESQGFSDVCERPLAIPSQA